MTHNKRFSGVQGAVFQKSPLVAEGIKRLSVVALTVFLVMTLVDCSNGGGSEIKAPGIVDGDIITLKTSVAGTLRRLTINEGDKVSKDQVVAEVNSDKIANQLNELEIASREIEINREKTSKKLRFLESNIQYLTRQVQRFKRLREKNSIPGEQVESMELKLLEAATSRFELQKNLEGLAVQEEKIANQQEYVRLLLGDHVVKAPVEGVVMEKFVSTGETVFPGTAIADILDTASLYVEIFIEEKEMAGLELNQKAGIRIDSMAAGDKELAGVISYFGKKAEFSPKYIISEKERQSLLYQVKIKIRDTDGLLKIGMPVTVVLNRNENAGKAKKAE